MRRQRVPSPRNAPYCVLMEFITRMIFGAGFYEGCGDLSVVFVRVIMRYNQSLLDHGESTVRELYTMDATHWNIDKEIVSRTGRMALLIWLRRETVFGPDGAIESRRVPLVADNIACVWDRSAFSVMDESLRGLGNFSCLGFSRARFHYHSRRGRYFRISLDWDANSYIPVTAADSGRLSDPRKSSGNVID